MVLFGLPQEGSTVLQFKIIKIGPTLNFESGIRLLFKAPSPGRVAQWVPRDPLPGGGGNPGPLKVLSKAEKFM